MNVDYDLDSNPGAHVKGGLLIQVGSIVYRKPIHNQASLNMVTTAYTGREILLKMQYAYYFTTTCLQLIVFWEIIFQRLC